MTVRENIKDYQKEIQTTELHPVRAAEILVELSALLGNINDELKNAQMSFNRHLLDTLNDVPVASKAKIQAETSHEYERLLEVKGTEKVALEMMRSLKYYIKEKREEYLSIV